MLEHARLREHQNAWTCRTLAYIRATLPRKGTWDASRLRDDETIERRHERPAMERPPWAQGITRGQGMGLGVPFPSSLLACCSAFLAAFPMAHFRVNIVYHERIAIFAPNHARLNFVESIQNVRAHHTPPPQSVTTNHLPVQDRAAAALVARCMLGRHRAAQAGNVPPCVSPSVLRCWEGARASAERIRPLAPLESFFPERHLR